MRGVGADDEKKKKSGNEGGEQQKPKTEGFFLFFYNTPIKKKIPFAEKRKKNPMNYFIYLPSPFGAEGRGDGGKTANGIKTERNVLILQLVNQNRNGVDRIALSCVIFYFLFYLFV